MNRVLYRVTCKVDNGWTCEHYDVYACASSCQQAVELAQSQWNSSYDTTVEVKFIEIIPLTEEKVICAQHLSSCIE